MTFGAILQDLERYRLDRDQAHDELATVDARRTELLSAIRRYDALIGIAIQLPLPYLAAVPETAVQRANARRATTRVGRSARPRAMNRTDQRVLMALRRGAITFSELKTVTGINEWTLRDALVRLQVAGAIRRYQPDGPNRALRYAKASLPRGRAQQAVSQ
jgi:hypothetical protein